ncbi:hypothetical protein EKJ_01740 [Qipengyuania flava]|uniref:Apea-like HEPN domain-containing protein n=1 Tax=Qipengyuania flava TaxID=192812 RepID=A0A3T1CED5_9SPHN|nr:hypothetical protein [Qipengyuania flava]BBI19327.1 hypothetical protein EKJ_01740 [Qipengyuania flava]
MTDHPLLEPTRLALAPLWGLTAPEAQDFYHHPAFTDFKSFCERTFLAADRGIGFSFGLSDALRGAGLPCLIPNTAAPSSLDEAARRIVEAFEATTVRRRYLCPLDLADALPTMHFGPASVRYCPSAELDRLFDGARLGRHYPGQQLDLPRLAEFQWLIVEEQAPLPERAGQRAMPFLYESWTRDFGAIEPHAGSHPAPVTDALFGLLLAPWEDWHSLETDWRGFQLPWMHVATDDLFVRPRPVPTADTLTWEDAAYQEVDGEVVEYERPVRIQFDGDAEAVLGGFNHAWWAGIEAATATSLFETPIKHFMVKAAFSDGMDQIMAHMTTIEAALGLRSDFNQAGRPKGARMSPRDRLAKRVEALLGDPKAGSSYTDLFETRSAFVHGRSIQGLVPSKDRVLARQLARRVTVALIDAAKGAAGDMARADYLNSLA